jgi:hypothetical protein
MDDCGENENFAKWRHSIVWFINFLFGPLVQNISHPETNVFFSYPFI